MPPAKRPFAARDEGLAAEREAVLGRHLEQVGREHDDVRVEPDRAVVAVLERPLRDDEAREVRQDQLVRRNALAVPGGHRVEERVVVKGVFVPAGARPVAHRPHRALDRGRHVDGAVRLEDERAHARLIVAATGVAEVVR